MFQSLIGFTIFHTKWTEFLFEKLYLHKIKCLSKYNAKDGLQRLVFVCSLASPIYVSLKGRLFYQFKML